jgi:hypothetical protein
MDRASTKQRQQEVKASESESNHLKLSIRERMEQFASARKGEGDRLSQRHKARRFLTIDPERRQEQGETPSPCHRKTPLRKVNYWDFTVVSLESEASGSCGRDEMGRTRREPKQLSSDRQKLLNRQNE